MAQEDERDVKGKIYLNCGTASLYTKPFMNAAPIQQTGQIKIGGKELS